MVVSIRAAAVIPLRAVILPLAAVLVATHPRVAAIPLQVVAVIKAVKTIAA